MFQHFDAVNPTTKRFPFKCNSFHCANKCILFPLIFTPFRTSNKRTLIQYLPNQMLNFILLDRVQPKSLTDQDNNQNDQTVKQVKI